MQMFEENNFPHFVALLGTIQYSSSVMIQKVNLMMITENSYSKKKNQSQIQGDWPRVLNPIYIMPESLSLNDESYSTREFQNLTAEKREMNLSLPSRQ